MCYPAWAMSPASVFGNACMSLIFRERDLLKKTFDCHLFRQQTNVSQSVRQFRFYLKMADDASSSSSCAGNIIDNTINQDELIMKQQREIEKEVFQLFSYFLGASKIMIRAKLILFAMVTFNFSVCFFRYLNLHHSLANLRLCLL